LRELAVKLISRYWEAVIAIGRVDEFAFPNGSKTRFTHQPPHFEAPNADIPGHQCIAHTSATVALLAGREAQLYLHRRHLIGHASLLTSHLVLVIT
jgi:hypothetical protein